MKKQDLILNEQEFSKDCYAELANTHGQAVVSTAMRIIVKTLLRISAHLAKIVNESAEEK